MKAGAVIAAVLAVLGHHHVAVGHAHIPVLWLVLVLELTAAAVLIILIRRAARWRTWKQFAT